MTNCVVICLDTFRADIVSAGTRGALDFVETPNLDALAADGVWFDNAYAEALPTIPARRSMFTGIRGFPWRWSMEVTGSSPGYEVPGWHGVPAHQHTLAERLVRNGYVTGLVSDTYHMFKPTMNFHRGFMSWEFIRGQEADPHRLAEASDLHLERYTRRVDNPRLNLLQWLRNTQGRTTEEEYTFPRCIERSRQFIDEASSMGPFFLWIDSFEAHEPWDPPREYVDRYMDAPWTGIEPIVPLGEEFSPEEKERARALYYGSCTFVDKWIGVLVQHLKDKGLLDDTIIVFTSDHGTQLDEHGAFGKSQRFMNAYNTRVNMLVRHPQGPSGKTISAPVQHIDLAPAILGWLDVPHEQLDGSDLWALATGEQEELRDWTLTVWQHEASVRDATWNAIVNVQDPDPTWRLYRIDEDRDNYTDVAAQHPDVIDLQRSRLEGFLGGKLPARFSGRHDPTRYPAQEFESSRRDTSPRA